MRKLIIIIVAGLGLLAGLGLVAAQNDDEPEHVPAQGYFERCWGESGEPAECPE